MSETKEPENKTARAGRKTITLNVKRTVETGHVRQSFSHGRSKSVVVEKKRSKKPVSVQEAPATASAPVAKEQAAVVKPKRAHPPAKRTTDQTPTDKSRTVLRQLSTNEVDARARALIEARKRAEVEAKERAEEERRRAEEDARRKAEETARAEEEALRKVEEAKEAAKTAQAAPSEDAAEKAPQKAETKTPAPAKGEARTADAAAANKSKKPAPARSGAAKDTSATPAAATTTSTSARPPRNRSGEEETTPARSRPDARAKKAKVATPVKKTEDERRGRGRLTITNALDEGQRERSLASLRRQRERLKKQSLGIAEPRKKIIRDVQLPEVITIQELANRMAERAVDVIKFLMKQGQMHKINDVIDADTAELIATEFGHNVKRVSEADVEEGFIGTDDDEADMQQRAPVVTIMGHVDHGKTSLLDALRNTTVVSGEAGGITQHIGAYQIHTDAGAPVTFIDTPGHAAFTAMRSRGAKVTDIVILVVAADDGVMPQTVEAINHAKAAGVPLIVAINKIDKPAADPQRVRTELLQHSIVVESMSGDTLEVEVSAKTGVNLDKLLEMIALQAEIQELKANADRPAEGVVIEAKLERGRGPVGTVLVQRGTLKVGQILVAGRAWGRVRALINDKGEHAVTAGPSVPVEILGFDSAPEAGDQFAVVENEARAREITSYRVRKLRDLKAGGAGTRTSLEQMMSQLDRAGRKEFSIIVKGDVQGSVEAIAAAVEKLGNDEVVGRIVHNAVGGITESDVLLASTSGSVIIGFNVRANSQAKELADRSGVEIRYYAVIYDLVDDIKAAMSGLLAPTLRETFLGNAEILEVFNITKVGNVAGCRITDGKVERGAHVRLIRDNVVIHEGKLSTLKRFKDEVKEVQGGQECGMAFENYQDMRKGDVIECFRVEEVKRTL
ncbi:MAG: translation initiation factor IF-2 [Alphaproteobacteria bacterium]